MSDHVLDDGRLVGELSRRIQGSPLEFLGHNWSGVAQIFLSYAREDQPQARLLANALERRGWSVWWDRHIPHGQDFRAYTQRELDSAACVVVLWSTASVDSQFVRDEASEGLNGRLVPALIEGVKPPLGFRQLQAASLTHWRGDEHDEEFISFLQSIESVVARPTLATLSTPFTTGALDSGRNLTKSEEVVQVTDTQGSADVSPSPSATPVAFAGEGKRTGGGRSITRLLAGFAAIVVIVVAIILWFRPWDQETCDQGAADDCVRQALSYANGAEGKAKDLVRAVSLYQKACDSGSVDGCTSLALVHWTGEGGLSIDKARANALFQKACDGSSAAGCDNLGLSYENGEGGLSKDMARAVALYRKACDGGSAAGCSHLATAYANGEGGLSKDLVRAVALFQKACDAGDSFGCKELNVFKSAR